MQLICHALAFCTAFFCASLNAGSSSPIELDEAVVHSGQALFVDRQKGHCLLCHQVNQITEPFQGNIGPDLSDAGNRLTLTEIRQRIVNPQALNPQTVMPAYHRVTELKQVGAQYVGRPMLTADEVTAVALFVSTLKSPVQGVSGTN